MRSESRWSTMNWPDLNIRTDCTLRRSANLRRLKAEVRPVDRPRPQLSHRRKHRDVVHLVTVDARFSRRSGMTIGVKVRAHGRCRLCFLDVVVLGHHLLKRSCETSPFLLDVEASPSPRSSRTRLRRNRSPRLAGLAPASFAMLVHLSAHVRIAASPPPRPTSA